MVVLDWRRNFAFPLPISYSLWKQLRPFEHGDMDGPQRAFDTFVMHANTTGVVAGPGIPRLQVRQDDDFSVLELGPGDSLFTGFIAKALGAARSYLADRGAFAARDGKAYKQLWDFLHSRRHELPAFDAGGDIEELLAKCHGDTDRRFAFTEKNSR
jgi:hypothetical protein